MLMNLKSVLSFLTLLAIVFLNDSVSYGDIYKYIDAEGVIHLTNVPTDHNVPYVLVMKEKRILIQIKGDINRYDDLIAKASERPSSKRNQTSTIVPSHPLVHAD
jgi:hypothetical protein